MCRFDANGQRDKDNLEIVCSNLEDLYDEAVKSCESASYIHVPELNPETAGKDLEHRMAASNSLHPH